MLKIKYSLFWILLSMPSCLGAGKTLTFFIYEVESLYGQYEYELINALTKEAIADEVMQTKKENPNSGRYYILADKAWVPIYPESDEIKNSLRGANVDFYTSDELKKAFKQLSNNQFKKVGLLSEDTYEKFYEEEYKAMKKAFEAYKESTQDDLDQDDKKPSFFTVQNSFFPVILLGTLVVTGFLLWLNNKKAPSEDKTPKAKKLKTELRRENDNPRSDTIATDD